MPQAGQRIRASDVTRARPTTYYDQASGTLPASSSAVDIPGISISFTTEVANADVTLWWTIQADPTAASTSALISARPRITAPGGGTTDSPVYATYGPSGVAAEQATVSQSWATQLGVPGTYTIVVKGSTAANQAINLYSTLTVQVTEKFS
ncbi:hypothetical protein OHA21_43870 [Actinoplanes sp. NBC_00393]|uniref:hypothetical protein n=1 Tax=Actinoplanes sp. NBC_00393 TaxID=2975953 RepID=UPI002E1A747F